MMKKLILLSMAAGLLFTACNKKTDEPADKKGVAATFDSTDIKTTPINPADIGSVNITYKMEKGKTYSYRLTSISEDEQSIKGDTVLTQKVKQVLTYAVDVKADDVDKDTVAEVTFTFKNVRLEADANGKKFNYYTGMKLDSADRQRYVEYEAIIDNPFNARINPRGEILEIFRADRIANKVLEMRGMKDSIGDNDRKLFVNDIVEGALKPVIGQLFRKLTAKQLAKDSGWVIAQPLVNFQLFGFQNLQVYRLSGFEKYNTDNLAAIDVRLDSKTIISPEAKKNKIDIRNTTFSGGGKIYFNLSKGVFQKTKTRTHISVEFTGTFPTPRGMQKLTRTQKTTNTNILELL